MTEHPQLSPETVDQWPEVLGDLRITGVPMPYLVSLSFLFSNGQTWNFELDHQTKTVHNLDVHLAEIVETYNASIVRVYVTIDVVKLKRDVSKLTATFFNKVKEL